MWPSLSGLSPRSSTWPSVFRVAQHRHEDLVELQVAAARVREGAHRFGVSPSEVGEEVVEPRIHGLADRLAADAAVHGGRRRYRDFGGAARMRLHEPEMLDHRMVAKAELAHHARAFRTRGHARKRDPLVHRIALDAVEPPEEIEVPPRAAELAVGDGAEPDLLLPLDDLRDLAVLDRSEVACRDLAARAAGAGLLDRRGAQKAADVVGAERRLVTGHCGPSGRRPAQPKPADLR